MSLISPLFRILIDYIILILFLHQNPKIYTAGVCSGNQLKENKGGYGAVIMKQGEEPLQLNRGYLNTTNNRMDLRAAIEALRRVSTQSPVTVYSSSQYLVTGITVWIHNWIAKGKIEKNGDLWMELYSIVSTFQDIQFIHLGINPDYGANRLATIACNYPGIYADVEMSYYIPM